MRSKLCIKIAVMKWWAREESASHTSEDLATPTALAQAIFMQNSAAEFLLLKPRFFLKRNVLVGNLG